MRTGKGRLSGGRMWWRLASVSLGIALTGCAAMTQDVDAYYRQMAGNYQEAVQEAKIDELRLENQSRMLLATGDQARYRKSQRELSRVRSWEEHCAWEKQRFEKAAKWMETHFDVDKKAKDAASAPPRARESAPTGDPEDTRGHDIP